MRMLAYGAVTGLVLSAAFGAKVALLITGIGAAVFVIGGLWYFERSGRL